MAIVKMSPEALAHHLRVAADHYTVNATDVETAARAVCDPPGPGWVRVAAQFTQQAKECREFADALDNIRSVSFDVLPDKIEVYTNPINGS